ncbi:MAG: response regulator, partial [Aquihabitans sp.]
MTDTEIRPIKILLVEDDAGDVLMTREALDEGKIANELEVVNDGIEALDTLRSQGSHERPDLVLLDLNLPRKGGLEVLAEMKADPMLRRIPVVILTTSEAEKDIITSYDHHANAYIKKPVDFDQFVKVVRQIDEFFVSVVV